MAFFYLPLGNEVKYREATQILITNAANLMKSIKEVIKSLKSAYALQNNQAKPGKVSSL